jgi:hypothetical protein
MLAVREERSGNMRRTRAIGATAAVLALGALGGAPAVADPQVPNVLMIEGFVQDQQCQGGDFVQVTLSATVESSSAARFRWDTSGDGRFDTPASGDPTVMVLFPDEVNRTVTIGGRNREGNTDRDTLSFATLRCEG